MTSSWGALSRQESERIAHRWGLGHHLKAQLLDDALAWKEDTIVQEHTDKRIAIVCGSTGIPQLDPIGKILNDDEEVRVHDRIAVVRELQLGEPPSFSDHLNVHLLGHVQELKVPCRAGTGGRCCPELGR